MSGGPGARRLAGRAGLALLAAGWIAAAIMLWKTRVPGDLRLSGLPEGGYFSPHELGRTSSFAAFSAVTFVLSQLALIATLALYAAKGNRFARESAAGRIGTGVMLGMLGFAFVWFARLPFELADLWWERRHGIAYAGYLDVALGSWLSLGGEFLFICIAIGIVMALAGWLGRRWWIAGAPVFAALALLQALVSPFLLPDLHPLRNQRLAAEARSLARSSGIPGTRISVQEVHRDTPAPNAGAGGIGPTQRVILWDTLLDKRFTNRQVRFVIAHELSHLSRNHIWKGIGWYGLFALPQAFLIAAVVQRRRGGLHQPSAVPLALLVSALLGTAVMPFQNIVSRHLEAEADWVGLEQTRDPAAARSLFQRFTTTSFEQPNPPGWQYVLLADHPTVMQRIAMARAWREREPER